MDEEELEVRWRSHDQTLLPVFDFLLSSNKLVDITLACDGKQIQAHRLVLAACSDYFQELLFENNNPNPIIYLKDVKHSHMVALLAHMYRGSFTISRDEYPDLIRTAQGLKIRGVDEITEDFSTTKPSVANECEFLPQDTNASKPSICESPLVVQEGTGEIPFLFYTELLQNSDMHELLAGKITQCLDSKNSKTDEDEVVKTVSTMAEKEIVDTFFKDFFEVELGQVQSQESNEEPAGFSQPASPEDPNLKQVEERYASLTTPPGEPELETMEDSVRNLNAMALCTSISMSNTREEPVSMEIASASTLSQDECIKDESTKDETTKDECTKDDSTKDECTHTATVTVPRTRTVITVVKDGFKTETAQNNVTSSLVTDPKPPKNVKKYKRPRLLSSVKPTSSLLVDTWTRLGRRSIIPKSPPQENVAENEIQVDSKLNQSLASSCERNSLVKNDENPYINTSTETPRNYSPVASLPITGTIPSTADETSPQVLNTSEISSKRRRSRLSSCLFKKINALLTQQQHPQSTPTTAFTSPATTPVINTPASNPVIPTQATNPTPIPAIPTQATTTLQKLNPNSRISRKKSFSTPRKRSPHVRNLYFKTPPSVRVDKSGREASTHSKEQISTFLTETFGDVKHRKVLEWKGLGISDLPNLPRIDEVVNDESHSIAIAPVPSLPGPWIPPPTPKILSPSTRYKILGSPIIAYSKQELSPEPNYSTTLRRLLGSPLAPGAVPGTPQKWIGTFPLDKSRAASHDLKLHQSPRTSFRTGGPRQKVISVSARTTLISLDCPRMEPTFAVKSLP